MLHCCYVLILRACQSSVCMCLFKFIMLSLGSVVRSSWTAVVYESGALMMQRITQFTYHTQQFNRSRYLSWRTTSRLTVKQHKSQQCPLRTKRIMTVCSSSSSSTKEIPLFPKWHSPSKSLTNSKQSAVTITPCRVAAALAVAAPAGDTAASDHLHSLFNTLLTAHHPKSKLLHRTTVRQPPSRASTHNRLASTPLTD